MVGACEPARSVHGGRWAVTLGFVETLRPGETLIGTPEPAIKGRAGRTMETMLEACILALYILNA